MIKLREFGWRALGIKQNMKENANIIDVGALAVSAPRLSRRLMLGRHTAAHGDAVILLPRLSLLLHVLVIRGNLLLLLICHVTGVHAGSRDVGLRRAADIVVVDVIRRLGSGGHVARGVHAILGASRLRRIQASLWQQHVSTRRRATKPRRRRPTHLNQVLALGFGDEGLQLGRRERVNKASFGYDQK